MLALNTGALPPNINLNSGNALFLSGATTSGLNFSNAGSFGLQSFGSSTAMKARLASMQKLLTFDTACSCQRRNGTEHSIQSAQEINAAINSAPALPVVFPNSGLGQQLSQVAQIVAIQASLGMSRQIFFVGAGGFDNHEDLVNKHQGLMAGFDAAVSAFVSTLELRGSLNNVTLFTESEFNRTGNANANVGTDHAWGSHHLVVGGAVHGGATYGTFPLHVLSGPDDAGNRGNWIPIARSVRGDARQLVRRLGRRSDVDVPEPRQLHHSQWVATGRPEGGACPESIKIRAPTAPSPTGKSL
jgi:hypothetical protein